MKEETERDERNAARKVSRKDHNWKAERYNLVFLSRLFSSPETDSVKKFSDTRNIVVSCEKRRGICHWAAIYFSIQILVLSFEWFIRCHTVWLSSSPSVFSWDDNHLMFYRTKGDGEGKGDGTEVSIHFVSFSLHRSIFNMCVCFLYFFTEIHVTSLMSLLLYNEWRLKGRCV